MRKKNSEIKICPLCKKPIEAPVINSRKCCSKSHSAFFSSSRRYNSEIVKDEVTNITWCKNLSYLIGMIASDGTLHINRHLIKISSKDYDLLIQIRDIVCDLITGKKNKILTDLKVSEGKTFKNYSYSFTSHIFYHFCLDIGLTPNKSLTISKLKVPKIYFSDFLRGEIDGDGNFNIIKRHLNNCERRYINIRIYSGSKAFLQWINETCSKNIYIYGIIYKDKEVKNKYVLFWSDG